MNYPHIDTTPTPDLERWMEHKSAQPNLLALYSQIEKAKKRKWKTTSVNVEELWKLMALAEIGKQHSKIETKETSP